MIPPPPPYNPDPELITYLEKGLSEPETYFDDPGGRSTTQSRRITSEDQRRAAGKVLASQKKTVRITPGQRATILGRPSEPVNWPKAIACSAFWLSLAAMFWAVVWGLTR